MRASASLTLLSAFVALSSAADSTSSISVLLLGTDPQPLVASVVTAGPSATTYVLNCPTGTDSNDCGTYDETIIVGKDFYSMTVTAEDFTAQWSCKVKGTTSASCFESYGGASANDPGTTHTVLSASEIQYFPVTITAGADKLAGGTSATPAPASASSTAAASATSTISIAFPAVDPTDLALSVVTAGPSSTVYKIGCALDVEGNPKNNSCGWTSGLNPWMTVGPSSFGLNITAETEVDTFRCAVSSTTSADCTTIILVDGKTRSVASESVVMTYAAATVTEGLEKLQASATGSSTGSGSGSGASSGAPSRSSTSSNGATPRETGALGLLALAGVVGAGMIL